jgi:hypothetical protein
MVFRIYRFRRQLVAFQKRFRLPELSLPEIRPEFDRNTSNAGKLQSGMPRLVTVQGFYRLLVRRHRVLSRIRRPETENPFADEQFCYQPLPPTGVPSLFSSTSLWISAFGRGVAVRNRPVVTLGWKEPGVLTEIPPIWFRWRVRLTRRKQALDHQIRNA